MDNQLEFAPFTYDLEESRNKLTYLSGPIHITGSIMKSKWISLRLVYDYAEEISRELVNNTHPISAMYIIKWVRDFSEYTDREVPSPYIRAHNDIIEDNEPYELIRQDPMYEEQDAGYKGFLKEIEQKV